MKHIAITQRRVRHATYDETRDCLDVRWSGLCQTLGCLPIVLPSGFALTAYLDEIPVDGVVISGGNDLSLLAPHDCLAAARDRFETELIHIALDRNIPLLGVCRGAQLIAAYFGAVLSPIMGHAGVRHRLSAAAGAMTTSPRDTVNSYHRYGIRRIRAPLLATATAADGSVEAFAHRDRPVYGIMWHPEREMPFTGADLTMMSEIFILSGAGAR